jgi:6-pyruvoyltetrahydropterin/6-carboxytetrahydropterin synthase
MVSTVTISHNFESTHRLPHLPGKCISLHGHSWWAETTVTAPSPDEDGVVVEFGPLKKALRAWIDDHVDHGVLLGPNDPLVPLLRQYNCKVYEGPGLADRGEHGRPPRRRRGRAAGRTRARPRRLSLRG